MRWSGTRRALCELRVQEKQILSSLERRKILPIRDKRDAKILVLRVSRRPEGSDLFREHKLTSTDGEDSLCPLCDPFSGESSPAGEALAGRREKRIFDRP